MGKRKGSEGRTDRASSVMLGRHLYCGNCHQYRPHSPVAVEYQVPRSPVVVTDMPAVQCSTCGQVYIDVRQAETVERIIQDRAGRLTIAEVMALEGVDEG